jgi:signal recognition particle receptor subunit beta
VLKGVDGVVFVADSQANKLKENMESWAELTEQLRRQNKNAVEFPIIMQWNKRDLPDVLPIPVLEQYLNPYRKPSFEAIAVSGRGVVESLRTIVNGTLRRLDQV